VGKVSAIYSYTIMKLSNLKNFLFLVFLLLSKHSICQFERTFLILDTADARYYSENYCEYYKDSIIRSKVFFYGDESKLHYEFIRVDINKYYCIEYTTDARKINEGIVIKESKAFDSLPIPVYDSNGNIIATKNINSYKFIKDELWYEGIDSFANYSFGLYKKGLRDSIWLVIRGRNIETEITYANGKIIKEEKINLAGSGNIKIKELLEREWDLITQSYSVPLKFVPGNPSEQRNKYLQFNKDGSFTGRIAGSVEISSLIKGSWQLTADYKKIKLTIKGKESFAIIKYISKYGLVLSFED
jgi:hypothetical protein